MNHDFNTLTPRENILMSLLKKLMTEYKALLHLTKQQKPLKIASIHTLSNIPGETIFTLQVSNKNCIAQLSAADILKENYPLSDFSDYHAEMIHQAAAGKLMDFLKLSETKPIYKIISKRFDNASQEYLFTLENNNQLRIETTATELSNHKEVLENINMQDVYDIGYTTGAESILKEKMALIMAKSN